jgi:hypothetical protein
MTTEWSEEEDAILIKGWNAGLSTARIAAQLANRSKNAVISRRPRLGLPDRISGGSPKSKAYHIERKIKQLRPLAVKMREADSPPLAPPARSRALSPKPLPPMSERDLAKPGVSLLELSPKGCRFILNTPEPGETHLFCNAQQHPGLSYCGEHALRCFTGVSARRPSRPMRLAA